jgi:RHS repeat-associated protein
VEKQPQPWRLAGEYFDEETGLCYVLARYYNPQLGRFLTPDPQGFNGGSLNLYTYCDGDPVNRIDPTGELAFLAIVGIIAVGAAIGALVGAGIEAWKQHKTHPDQPLNWGEIGSEAWKGAVVGAVGTGVGLLLGPLVGGVGAGLATAMAGGAVIGGVSAGIEQCVSNALHHKPLTEGIWPAIGIGAGIGAVTAGIGGIWANRARRAAQAAREAEEEVAAAAR